MSMARDELEPNGLSVDVGLTVPDQESIDRGEAPYISITGRDGFDRDTFFFPDFYEVLKSEVRTSDDADAVAEWLESYAKKLRLEFSS